MKPSWRFASLVLAAALELNPAAAFAQAYPSKAVHIVVPYAAGGTVDFVARLIAPKMSDAMRQPVVVDNRAGAGARIGEEAVAKSDPDGHTILIDASGITISPALYHKLPFDPARDFIPVTQLVATMNLMVASQKAGISSVKDLIARAKAKPGVLTYGHTGVGSSLQLAMELFKQTAGIDLLGVPYKGVGPVVTAVMTGEVNLAVVAFSTDVLQAVKSGRLRPLAVSGSKRSPMLPEVPTYAETGVDVEHVSWYGLFVPAKTPARIVETIQREASKALNAPDVRKRIVAMGLEPVGGTTADFQARYRADLAKYQRIVKEARIPLMD
jgi:tripartite-type tricarboxylate transporter receptor subunit TctC